MTSEPRLDILGAALADPSRARILCELMDGRAFTNKELAAAAGVGAPTASAHLAQLAAAGLTCAARRGRCVYHRIASAEVAEALEGLARLSPSDHLQRGGAAGEATLRARSCYNHIAGRLGVLMAERLLATDVLRRDHEDLRPGPRYLSLCAEIGLAPPAHSGRKAPARLCLDWTERRDHLSGPFATALMRTACTAGWLRRQPGSRALAISPSGYATFERVFGLSAAAIDGAERA